MAYSAKINVQLLGEILLSKGVTHIVISPGSRNAPLTLHFTHHQKFTTYSVVDERSAGFFALGMAQQLGKPVVVCCTSGSATVNYYPALVEAFYQNIPLIVLSADRPETMVDQFDGQTIRQKNVFENHCLKSIQLTEDESDQSLVNAVDLVSDAINICVKKQGPIHINIPFSEPLYVTTNQLLVEKITTQPKVEEEIYPTEKVEKLVDVWNASPKKIILVGLQKPNKDLKEILGVLSQDSDVVILTENTSNLHNNLFFSTIDQLIFPLNEVELAQLKPDLLITIGQNVVSKKIKSFLRNHQPDAHWHIDTTDWKPNTYNCLTGNIQIASERVLKEIVSYKSSFQSNYYQLWNDLRKLRIIKHNRYLENIEFCDFKAFETILKQIPDYSQIHFSNSSTIRYAQLLPNNPTVDVFCNRGTSGIDGCTGTAIGAAVVNNKPTTLVTGDVGFFYDSNSLWNNYIPNDFRIIVLNNGGGNIFKIIPGPAENSSVIENYFETKHNMNAKSLAEMFNFEYILVNNQHKLQETLVDFYKKSSQPKLLEIDTKNQPNATILKAYFNQL